MADQKYILNKVKEIVLKFDPNAEIILYGSRARGTATYESDWDFLILTEIDFNNKMKFKICHELYEIEWETCEVIVPIIHYKNYWFRDQNRVTPFFQNVTNEGIAL